jgi:Protein tyrosine/serine phosphatase
MSRPIPAGLPPPTALAPLTPWRRFRAWMHMLWLDHAFFRFIYNTRFRVADGVYRSSHPMPQQLRDAARAGVRTVLSLRGPEVHMGSNRLEWDACRRLDMRVVHFAIGSRDAPSREELLGLEALLRTLPRPLLIHCKSGADRAGLASALYLMLVEGRPLEEARRQLDFWRHGHIRQAKTGILDHFLECYRERRDATGIGFMDWVREEYDRDAVRRSFRAQWWANQIVDRVLRRE